MEPSPATMGMGLLMVIMTKTAKIKKCDQNVDMGLTVYVILL
jgi:hypothetical protein